jgi:hypothetical protein
MARTSSHISVRHPQIFLPLPTLPRAHRHIPILSKIAVETMASCRFENRYFHHGLLGETTLGEMRTA